MDQSKRVQQAESRVQQIVASYFSKGCRNPLVSIATVSRVIMPADLRSAKVYVSFLGDSQHFESDLKAIQKERIEIQRYLSQQMPMRFCPVLSFYEDQSTNQLLKIESLLREIRINQASID